MSAPPMEAVMWAPMAPPRADAVPRAIKPVVGSPVVSITAPAATLPAQRSADSASLVFRADPAQLWDPHRPSLQPPAAGQPRLRHWPGALSLRNS